MKLWTGLYAVQIFKMREGGRWCDQARRVRSIIVWEKARPQRWLRICLAPGRRFLRPFVPQPGCLRSHRQVVQGSSNLRQGSDGSEHHNGSAAALVDRILGRNNFDPPTHWENPSAAAVGGNQTSMVPENFSKRSFSGTTSQLFSDWKASLGRALAQASASSR